MLTRPRGIRLSPGVTSLHQSVPRLAHLCRDTALLDILSNILRNKSSAWQNPALNQLKSRFQEVPLHLLKDIYQELFFVEYRQCRRLCCCASRHLALMSASSKGGSLGQSMARQEWKKLYSTFDGKQLFALWWMFLDEDHTKELPISSFVFYDGNFNQELLGYLASVKTHLTSLHLSYNWFLKADYIKMFTLQTHLCQLNLYSEINDTFLDVMKMYLKNLTSVTFLDEAKFQRASLTSMSQFLNSHAHSMTELLWKTNENQICETWFNQQQPQLWRVIGRMSNLTNLEIHGNWLIGLESNLPPFNGLKNLTLVSARFPALSKLTVDTLITADDDLEHVKQFCDRAPATKIRFRACVMPGVHPMNILTHIPTAERLMLMYSKPTNNNNETDDETTFNTSGFDPNASWPFMEDLHIEADFYRLQFQDFKLLWHSFPCLTKLTITLLSILNFDMSSFRSSLKTGFTSGSLRQLTSVDLRILSRSINAQVIGDILNFCPKLQAFDNLLFFNIPPQLLDQLTKLVEKKGGRFVTASHLGGQFWCSQEGTTHLGLN